MYISVIGKSLRSPVSREIIIRIKIYINGTIVQYNNRCRRSQYISNIIVSHALLFPFKIGFEYLTILNRRAHCFVEKLR